MKQARALQAVLSWLLYPLLVVGGVMAVQVATARGIALPLVLVGLQSVMMLVIGGLERWMPEHASWNVPRNDVRTDVLYLIVSGFALSLFFRTAIFAGTPSLGVWPTTWPVVAQLVLAIVLSDLGSYATHVLAHRVRVVWPIHAPHHSAQRLYWLNATRMHPFDQASTIVCSLVPLALLGTPPAVLALFDAFAVIHLMLQHSNVRLRHGALSHVIATAEFHRWHHSTLRKESEGNYASFFSLWDHLFRTFRMPRGEQPPEEVGLYDGATLAPSFIEQLRSPFRAWRSLAATRAPRDAR